MMGLSFLMIALLSFGGFTTLGFILKKKMLLSSHCAFSVLKLQNDLRIPLKRLLAMNRKASALRLQRRLAKIKLASAVAMGNPALIAAARLKLTIITEKQLVLKVKQQGLLLEARLRRQQFHLNTISPAKRIQRKTHFFSESESLAVAPSPVNSLSPSYVLKENFQQSQGQSYELKQTLRLVPQGVIHLHERCSATLKKKGLNKWTPTLKKANASWRHLYGSL